MTALLLLLTAHFISDFYLQSPQWLTQSTSKSVKIKTLCRRAIIHALLYTLVLTTIIYLTPTSLTQAIIAVFVITAGHLMADLCKSPKSNNLVYFLLDQLLRIVILVIVWAVISNITFIDVIGFLKQLITPKTMILGIAYLLVCKPASVLIALALKKHTDALTHNNMATRSDTLISQTPDKTEVELKIEKENNVGLISAGSWIGYIERCLAISFIFMGQFAGIGFLVATKTIFRFGDLTKNKDMKLTEYMLLGTLISYAIALFIGWNAMLIYKSI
ncbi:DUF3307 domain-containing protein [Psychrosphaera sp. B3R10]|uniref:DUF3307 domain-containing protein n=1 Tax=unclassified Psychrosphaera TaxID=2641570 RepID=UPI001C089D39|nr:MULTISPECIES: DUF3307 domain-containing protein [unclassified Psychrosphaera]MBU2880531.1 DUF3307 domain-containing protein [Psychrosphaera sp. I2R16]MBU2989148.1 DUF3307 domain-containing protein [Psychrosphaera sp. B3R10]